MGIYGKGGYVKNLGQNQEESAQILADLNANNWIDRGTRAVFVDFTTYNANINLFCQIRLILKQILKKYKIYDGFLKRLTIEMPATGGATPSWSFRSVKLIRYVSSMDYFVMTCEFIFLIYLVYYSIEEIIEVNFERLLKEKYWEKFLKNF